MPFYTVEENSAAAAPQEVPAETAADADMGDYRTAITKMLLSLPIASPARLANRSVGEHLAATRWGDPAVAAAIQKRLYFGEHSALCLAHGRSPLIPVCGSGLVT